MERLELSGNGNAPKETLPAFSVLGRLHVVSGRVHGWAQVRTRQRTHYGEVGRFGTLAG
jgi:hypothetical protein